jgi:MFS family permease
VLAITVLGSGIAALDATVVNIALPTIGRDFHTGIALASAACGFAPSVLFLIMTRVLQGAGAALLTPGSLAILEASFRPADRARAIGAWSGLGGVAVAAGPLVGGYLISVASWRWIFFINVPIAALVVALGGRHVPESRDPSATGKIDYLGAVTVAVFLSGVTFAFIEAPVLGWSSPTVLTMASLGVAGLAAFLIRERR